MLGMVRGFKHVTDEGTDAVDEHIPISKSRYALAQVPSSLIFGIYHDVDVYLG